MVNPHSDHKSKMYSKNTQKMRMQTKHYIRKERLKPQGKKEREERNRRNTKMAEKINKMAVSTSLSIITLNVNAVNSPIKT